MPARTGSAPPQRPLVHGSRQDPAMARLPSTTALLCLEAAARLGSFTRAGAELHLTQAAVSRQVLGLEQRLGLALFVRGREALRLTDAGRAYLDDVRPALATLERATAGVMALQGRGGPLNLSVASSLGNYWLIPRLPAFTLAHPQITLNIATRVGPADFHSGEGTRLDASLEFGDGRREGVDSRFVLPLEVSPCAAPAWVRVHGRALGPHTPGAALIRHRTVPDLWPRWFARAGLQPPPLEQGPRHDLMSMALNAALAGLGVALLPDFMTADALQRRRLVRLSPVRVRPEAGYWLVVPAQAAARPAVRAFGDWVQRQAAEGGL